MELAQGTEIFHAAVSMQDPGFSLGGGGAKKYVRAHTLRARSANSFYGRGPGGGGAFHQAFCQCFSLTNLLSANQMQGFQ